MEPTLIFVLMDKLAWTLNKYNLRTFMNKIRIKSYY